MKARYFVLFWFAGTLGVLTYAGCDLWATPSLTTEESFSLMPDWSHVSDLTHWGGRLLHQGVWGLLVSNAIILGGLIALATAFVIGRFTAKADQDSVPERISIFED